MARTEDARLILENSEMQDFLQQVNHPDAETIQRRNAFFEELDRMELFSNNDGGFEFEFNFMPVSSAESAWKTSESIGRNLNMGIDSMAEPNSLNSSVYNSGIELLAA